MLKRNVGVVWIVIAGLLFKGASPLFFDRKEAVFLRQSDKFRTVRHICLMEAYSCRKADFVFKTFGGLPVFFYFCS